MSAPWLQGAGNVGAPQAASMGAPWLQNQQQHPPAQGYVPRPTAPPSDPEVASTIKKLAEYVHKNGADFERMMKEKQTENTKFSFLFGGDGHDYYCWCKHCAAMNITAAQVAAQVAVHLAQQPPPAPIPTLTDAHKAELRGMLSALSGTKDNIKTGQKWMMERWKESRDVMALVLKAAQGRWVVVAAFTVT